ncbi:unnamed protein product [Macrosiphum euphorbiae]|uniref:Uncharacterized protein n=1 Tax=Macrosiphum euphorbiae TaxID=13131 RepID=A0AAV0WKV3_9HEMI|nr:unnamed protein product [Macrosiphum euphorbiae]
MGKNVPPVARTVRMQLQTFEFLRELKNELIESTNHTQITRGEVVRLHCFSEHIRRANSNMTIPFRPNVLARVMIHVNDFVRTVIVRPNHNRPMCVELGLLIEQLIRRRDIIEAIFEE